MIRLLIFFAFVIFLLLGAMIAAEHKATNGGLPLVHAAAPQQRVVVPWILNTRCSIDSRNLQPRETEA